MVAASPWRAKNAVLPLLLLCASGCELAPIDDLRVAEVRHVPAAQVPDLELAATMADRGEAAWRVSLEGGAGWATTIRRYEMNGYALVVRCDDRNSTLFALGPYVGSMKIAYGSGPKFESWNPGNRSTVRYDIYIPESGIYRSAADFNAPMPAYDLRKGGAELCIKLGGGAMTGFNARSNEVRLTLGMLR